MEVKSLSIKMLNWCLLSFCALFLVSFLTAIEANAAKAKKTAEEDYLVALADFANGSYSQALKEFEDIEQEYPEFHFNHRVITMQAFLSFLLKQYDKTVTIVDAFAELYPAHRNLPYLYYLRAEAKFRKIKSPMKQYDIVNSAKADFLDLINRYPASPYIEQAQRHIIKLDDMLAFYEFRVAQFHYGRDEYFASIRRYQTLLHLPENRYQVPALKELSKSYAKLGICNQSERYLSIYKNSGKYINYSAVY